MSRTKVDPNVGRIWVDVLGRQVLSPRGSAFLMREEGVVPYAYRDPIGLVTFGVGHLVQPRHTTITALDRLRYGTKADPKPKKAVRVFRRDARKFEKAVRWAAQRKLPQHKFDALVSLAFNIGVGGFTESTVARRVRAREKGVGEAIRMWDQPSILKPRREREVRLYQDGVYV
jgi:lysozyme